MEEVSTWHDRHGGTRRGIAFLTDYSVVDRIISYLKLTFIAEKPPTAQDDNAAGTAPVLWLSSSSS